MGETKEAAVYDVPALVVTPEQPPTITGNYEAIERTLEKWKASVSKMKLTEDNLDEVQTVKRAAVAVRNNLDRVTDATKKALFNDPKKIFEARVKLLYSLVADVEGLADNVLSKLEEQRVEEINCVLNDYKNGLQEKYQLDVPRYNSVEYRKDYYNKTVPKGYSSMDKYWKESLEEQFKDLKKSQDAYAANIRLIQGACKDEGRLNVQHWIEKLRYMDVASIIECITEEKERLHGLDTKQTVTTSTSEPIEVEAEVVDVEATKKVILGVPVTLDFNSDFPDRMKIKRLEISYPCDLGDTLTELFKILEMYGIKAKALKEEAVF